MVKLNAGELHWSLCQKREMLNKDRGTLLRDLQRADLVKLHVKERAFKITTSGHLYI